jgi:hypothetical protein
MPVHEIERLDEAIMALAPKMIGSVDCIEATDMLSGWVKLSPRGRAHLTARRGDQVLGECTADLYREDLCHLGDGFFKFMLKLSENIEPTEILRQVVVRAYYESFFLGYVPYWDKITIRPLLR